MRFFVVKKKHLMWFLTAFLVFVIIIIATFSYIKVSSPKKKYTVVIDAGHGGRDVK